MRGKGKRREGGREREGGDEKGKKRGKGKEGEESASPFQIPGSAPAMQSRILYGSG